MSLEISLLLSLRTLDLRLESLALPAQNKNAISPPAATNPIRRIDG